MIICVKGKVYAIIQPLDQSLIRFRRQRTPVAKFELDVSPFETPFRFMRGEEQVKPFVMDQPSEAMAYLNLHDCVICGSFFLLHTRPVHGSSPLCGTAEGDRVCVVLGCLVPFVVRPIVDGWTSIREC